MPKPRRMQFWKRLSEWFLSPGDSFAKTLANGSTVLDLERAKGSPRFEELKKDLEQLELANPTTRKQSE